MTPPRLWSESVGFLPHKVTVYENAQKGRNLLYLKWRTDGKWQRRSLGAQLRDNHGRILPEVRTWAREEAQKQYEINSGRRLAEGSAPADLTIGGAWALISDPKTGLYPVLTPHAKEVATMLGVAAEIWGGNTPWNVIDRSRIRMLGRTRVDQLRAREKIGLHGAEVLVRRVLTVAAWLRDEGKIAPSACVASRRWKAELREYWTQVAKQPIPEPTRPRYTLEEMRKILAAAPLVDPRFALLVALGAELRLGQVRRARRSDIDTEQRTFTARGAGKKKGTIVELTRGQWAAWEAAVGPGGYLEELERQLPDYYLFPQGKLPGRKKGHPLADPARHGRGSYIEARTVGIWWEDAELKAKVSHVRGRLAYGVRRVAVDAVAELGISDPALMAHGGWTDPDVPRTVYAERNAKHARAEAARLRAQVRGEAA